jgi:hypothetical protein
MKRPFTDHSAGVMSATRPYVCVLSVFALPFGVSGWTFLRMEMFQTKFVEKSKTHFNNFSENRTVLWDKVEQYGRAR